ncbi:helix-turn-helix domain-containing protein [Hungatella hathewayi]|uniref:GH39 family glycosyl hydrolase n=1 Tax=Hungatella hathewayi TaxID=154046 RepID=UPI002108C853|nr:helix-turn-helix domain-containing protein [Hungatella hathewayi]
MEEIRFEVDCDISESHYHDEMEIMFVLSGRIAIMVFQRNFVLQPEDFIVFNPFEYHELYREAGCHTISMFISMSVLQQSRIGYIRCCSCIQQEHAEYLQLIRTKLAVLFKNYMDAQKEQRLYIISQLYGLLSILNRQFEVPKEEYVGSSTDTGKFREIMLYINKHFSEELSQQQVAEQTYLSPSYLSRILKKQLGINFSDYLRNLRLNKAELLLRTTEESVTDIALNCGFANTNTMIVNFKNIYGMTPGAYRKQYAGKTMTEPETLSRDKASYLRLLKHAASEENMQPLNKQHIIPTHINIDMSQGRTMSLLCHRESLSVGWARSLLEENVRNAVRRAVRDIGFRYITCYGLLDDVLDVYHEDDKGNPWFNFTYIDMIVDFMLYTGLIPWIEFSFTPIKLREDADNVYGESNVQLPVCLEKWGVLVEAVMRHLIDYYGIDTIRNWHFSILPAFFTSYGVFSVEEYLEYYRYTYRSIRQQLPEAIIMGGSFDVGFLRADGEEALKQFLKYCIEHNCLPDELCFQSFSCDYSGQSKKEVEKKIRANDILLRNEPAPPSADSDNLKHEIAFFRGLLDSFGLRDYKIRVDAWNSTIWQRDLGNDTCFKAAYIVKNVLENAGSVTALTYCHLTDNSEQRIPNSGAYHGGNGLMTYHGIPKAAYHAYCLLNRLGSVWLAQGDGYIATRSADGRKFQILLYHYCHYDMDCHISSILPEEEERTIDRYYEFCDPGVHSFWIYLSGISQGEYKKESYTINREMGSSYDKWMEMGAPKTINPEQKDILEKSSAIGYKYETMQVTATGTVLVSAVLDAHEVRLICIERNK